VWASAFDSGYFYLAFKEITAGTEVNIIYVFKKKYEDRFAGPQGYTKAIQCPC